VFEAERDATVTERPAADEKLREAFQSLGQGSPEKPSPGDLDLVWRAVTEELPAPERRALVDRMASEPALAESWRIARELYRDAPQLRAAVPPGRAWNPWWMSAAAALLIAAGVGLILQLSSPAVEETFRSPDRYVVDSLVLSDTALPRDAFRLRWTPGPEGSRYHVRVTTEDLQVLTTASDLLVAELVVSSDRLAAVPSGARVFWQVDVALPEGNTVSSQTFVATVR
jgi:hypothetical protein